MRTRSKPVRPWLALSALSVGFFVIMLDTAIVNVAIPTMIRDLRAGLNQIIWVNSVYLLTFAVPLLFAGRLGDRIGRKPMFLAGMAIFTVASLGCGLSTSLTMLIVARGVQGLGAAAMAPQMIAFITHLFPPDHRGGPMGVWGTVGALAATAGPLLGGVLVGGLGWQWIFLVNVPIGVVGLVLAALVVPNMPKTPDTRLDVLGIALSGLGLFAFVFGLQNGQQYRWGKMFGEITVAEVIAAGVLLLIAFVVWQRFAANQPLLPLSLFRHRNFAAAGVAVLAVSFGLTGLYLPLTLYLQSVLGLSPLRAGLTTMFTALGAGTAGPLAGRLSDRISGKYVVMGGFLAFATGIGIIATIARTNTGPWTLSLALVLCGLGAGSAFAPLVNVATRNVPMPLMGTASGVYNTFRQVGSVIGSAAVGVLLQARLEVGMHTAAVEQSAALPSAFRQWFVDRADHAAGSSIGSGGAVRGAALPAGMPGAVAGRIAGLLTRAFDDGFTEAARTTLLLPIAVLLLGLTVCLTMARRTQQPDTTPDRAEVLPSANRATVIASRTAHP